MTIISVPHPVLRAQATPVTAVDESVRQFMSELGQTLVNHRNPHGVGLAAPQVDKTWRIFATNLPETDDEKAPAVLEFFINPHILKHSPSLTLGDNPEEPILEGCLSIPKLYGPVPRWEWIEVEYQTLEHEKLVNKKKRLSDFASRVVQHEYDHLEGILFTDYTLKYDLPIYQENHKTKKLEEVDPRILLAF